MTGALAFAALLAAAVPAGAEDGGGNAGLALTAGSNAYREASARATFDLRNDVYLSPRVTAYRSDDADGTYKQFWLRGGYEPGRWSFGADAGVQPRVDGYEKSSLGGDAAYSFPLSEQDRKKSLDLGGGALLTHHSDEFASGSGGRGRGAERTSVFSVRESDLFVFSELRSSDAALIARLTSCSYDRDLAAADARRVLTAGGDAFGAAVFGFPKTIASVKLRIKSLPPVRPFVSYARTTFELGDPPSNAYDAGADVDWARGTWSASVELYRQAGAADRRYLTVGASLDF